MGDGTVVLTFNDLRKLLPCRWCGAGPRGVDLGEFCPMSDPADPDLHDLYPSEDR